MSEKPSAIDSFTHALSRVGTGALKVTLSLSALIALAKHDALSLADAQEPKDKPAASGSKEPGALEKKAETPEEKLAAYRQAYERGNQKDAEKYEKELVQDPHGLGLLLSAVLQLQRNERLAFSLRCRSAVVAAAKGGDERAITLMVDRLGGLSEEQGYRMSDMLSAVGIPAVNAVYGTFDGGRWKDTDKKSIPDENRRKDMSARAHDALRSMLTEDPKVIPDDAILPRAGKTLLPDKKEDTREDLVRLRAAALLMCRPGGLPILRQAAKDAGAASIILQSFSSEIGSAKKGEFLSISPAGEDLAKRYRDILLEIELAHSSLTVQAGEVRMLLKHEEESRATRLKELKK